MFAIIKTGGKQYKVKEKSILKIEKLEGEAGKAIEFGEVLAIFDDKGEKVELGAPMLKTEIPGKILKQGRGKKVTIIKYKPKVRYKKKQGHRQLFTEVEIGKIGA